MRAIWPNVNQDHLTPTVYLKFYDILDTKIAY